MTEPAWTPRSLPDPPPRAGRGGARGWALALLGCLPIGVVAAFWTRALPTTVRTEAELAAVGFGWPFTWTTQDQTRYSPQSFPMTAEYVGPKSMADPLTTHVEWAWFAADCAVLWAAACAILTLVSWILRKNGAAPRSDRGARGGQR